MLRYPCFAYEGTTISEDINTPWGNASKRDRDMRFDPVMQGAFARFYDAAKPYDSEMLPYQEYVAFYQRVALALFTNISIDVAQEIAAQDWLYDNPPGEAADLSLSKAKVIAFEPFALSMHELAQLVLPINSPRSFFNSFYSELERSLFIIPEICLCSINRVNHICEAFQQNSTIFSGQSTPVEGKTASKRSLKHCIYGSRKSEPEYSQQVLQHLNENHKDEEDMKSGITGYSNGYSQILDSTEALVHILRVFDSAMLPPNITDDWDVEEAKISALLTQQATVVAVVGPTGSGKSRIAKYLAEYFGFVLCSIETAVTNLMAKYGNEARKRFFEKKGITYDLDGNDEKGIDEKPNDFDVETSNMCEILEQLLSGGELSKFELIDIQMRYAQQILQSENIGVVLDDLDLSESCEVKCNYLVSLHGNDNVSAQKMHRMVLNSVDGEHYIPKELALSTPTCQEVHHVGETAKGGYIADNHNPIHEKIMSSAGVRLIQEECELANCSFRNLTPIGGFSAGTSLRSDENVTWSQSSVYCNNGTTRIPILVTQPISTILEQCILEIHRNLLGISNLVIPRKALSITLPDDIIESSRTDQVIWLLQSGNEIDSLDAGSNAWKSKQRTLSKRWKQFCPVSFDRNNGQSAVNGDPAYSAYLHGHIYMLASEEFRVKFCLHPEKYLGHNPAKEYVTPSRILLGMGPDDLEIIGKIARSLEIDRIINVAAILETMSSLDRALSERLLEGQIIPYDEILFHISSTLLGLNSWLLFGLPPTFSVIETLTNHKVQIDAILLLDDSNNATDSQSLVLDCKENGQVCDVPIKVVHWESESINNVLICIRQAFNPFLPQSHVDTLQDGTFNDKDRYQYVQNAIASFSLGDTKTQTETISLELSADNPNPPSAIRCHAKQQMLCETGLFCPVAWKTLKELVQSGPDHLVTVDGYHYCLSGPEALEAFSRNPFDYVPSSFIDTDTVQFVPWILLLNIPRSYLGERLVELCGKTFLLQEIEYGRVKKTYREKLLVNSLKDPESRSDEEILYLKSIEEAIFTTIAQGRLTSSIKPIIVALQDTMCEVGEISIDRVVNSITEYKLSSAPMLVISLNIAQETFIEQQLMEWKKSISSKNGRIDTTSLSVSKAHEHTDLDSADVDVNNLESLEREKLETKYQEGISVHNGILERLGIRGIAILPISLANETIRQSIDKVKYFINNLHERKSSLLQRCEVLTYQEMLDELIMGRSIISNYNTTCPLTFLCGAKHDESSFKCVNYRNRLYFPDGEHNLKRFVANPATYVYISNRIGESAHVRLQCCIVGPPKMGKTTLALDLASHYDLVYVSPHTAVAWIQRYSKHTLLGSYLTQNVDSWPASVLYIAIMHRICAGDCQSRGWVLDDFFLNDEEWEQTKRINHEINGAFPSVMFYLKRKDNCCNAYSKLTSSYTMAFGAFHLQQLISMKDSASSSWKILDKAKQKLDSYLRLRREYNRVMSTSKAKGPVGMYGVLLHQKTVEDNLNENVQLFCPVELTKRCLFASYMTDRRHIVQYNGSYYFCANKENLETFLQNADKILGTISDQEDIKSLVSSPPIDFSITSLFMDLNSKDAEFKGFCPVTLELAQTGIRKETAEQWKHLVKGSDFHRASFCGKVYLFASEMQKQRFLFEPHRYIYQKLPHKLPPSVRQPVACSKACVSHYEQELDVPIQKAMLLIGKERPKLPGTSTKASACILLGLMLKTDYSAISEKTRTRYQKAMGEFKLDCGLLEVLKSAISSQMFCGAGINLIRAVRSSGDSSTNVSTSTESTTMIRSDSHETQEIRKRFDLLLSESAEPSRLVRYIIA